MTCEMQHEVGASRAGEGAIWDSCNSSLQLFAKKPGGKGGAAMFFARGAAAGGVRKSNASARLTERRWYASRTAAAHRSPPWPINVNQPYSTLINPKNEFKMRSDDETRCLRSAVL